MAKEIIAALDETGATDLIHSAQSALGTLSDSGSGSLGPFTASWSASASFSGGSVDLIPNDIIRIDTMKMNYSLGFSFSFDLSTFLPDFCLPRVCIPIPFDGKLCTPKICVNWPTVSVPLSFSDSLTFTADFKPDIFLAGGKWDLGIRVVGVPFLQLGPAAALVLAALSVALAALLAPIPFIGPFLAAVVVVIINTIGIAGVLGLLGAILTPFVSGLRFRLGNPDQIFTLPLPSSPIDPDVKIRFDLIEAAVQGSDEDELVLSADISPA